MKEIKKFPAESTDFGTKTMFLQEISSFLAMVDNVDTRNQDVDFLEKESSNFEGNVLSSLTLTNVANLDKSNLPSKAEFDALKLDFMLEHDIDSSDIEGDKESFQKLC